MSQVTLSDGIRSPISSIPTGSSLSIQVDFDIQGSATHPVLGVIVKTDLGAPLFGVNNRFIPGFEFDKVMARARICCNLADLPLMPGAYLLDLFFGNESQDLDVVHEAIGFDVTPADIFGSGKLPPKFAGPILWPATWAMQPSPERQ